MASINVVDTNLMKPLHFNISENKTLKKNQWFIAGTCFGKARPNQYQSTPQPLPKHILRVCFWCLLGRALAFVGMCFPECALVLPECALALPGVCFAKGWGPKKIPKITQILFPPKCKKHWFLLVSYYYKPETQNQPKMIPK